MKCRAESIRSPRYGKRGASESASGIGIAAVCARCASVSRPYM